MKLRLFLLLLCSSTLALAQENRVDWRPGYPIGMVDFQGANTSVGTGTEKLLLQSGVGLDFGFQMSNFEFMATRNFNSKVSCYLQRDAAILTAPDSVQAARLLRLAAFDFDLSELYARKIRKELFENKKTFSKSSFFQPYFDTMIAERNKVSARMYRDSDFGAVEEVLGKEHAAVTKEIEALAEFCKDCKPSKKRKQAN